MPRRFENTRLVLASHNRGKLVEIADLLRPFAVDVISAGDLGLAEPEETGLTFAQNAELKALTSARGSGFAALADDSGLVVPALGGAPGIYSARWAGPEKDFGAAMRRLEVELGTSSDRRAHFACALCLAWPDGHCETLEGTVHGRLVFPPRGEGGFGYDPVFVADGFNRTFGEIEPAEKHAISHRAEAFRKLVAACFA
ncbi:MAG: RdgB/HAM1 family non-canonical purine NTP pyrophosphatase [Rhodospirillales bacterium]|nr:RdgB/HAM1 family non-canonical purine NTP pyrophosphatase [Rhodospirillales bacterium]